jgi:hypothetical protein
MGPTGPDFQGTYVNMTSGFVGYGINLTTMSEGIACLN